MGAQWVHIYQIWICLLDLVLKYWSRYELHITGAGSLSDSMNHKYAVSPEQNGLIFLDCNTFLRIILQEMSYCYDAISLSSTFSFHLLHLCFRSPLPTKI